MGRRAVEVFSMNRSWHFPQLFWLVFARVGFVKRTHIYARRRQLSNLASRLLVTCTQTYMLHAMEVMLKLLRLSDETGAHSSGALPQGRIPKTRSCSWLFPSHTLGEKLAGIDGISGWGYEIDKKTLYRGRSRYPMHCFYGSLSTMLVSKNGYGWQLMF